MSLKKLCSLLLAITMLGVFVTGCSSTANKTGNTKIMHFGAQSEPETLDPRKMTGENESHFATQIYEGLTVFDGDANAVAAVAEKWDISPDGTKYTFYLRKDAKWSNGDPVTAQDFEYAWKTALSPELGSHYADMLFYIKNGEEYNSGKTTADQVGVTAVNDQVLEVVLKENTPFFLQLAAFQTYMPVHKKTVESNPDWAADPKTIVCNGPFKIANWIHNEKVEFVKNEKYWDAKNVKLDKLEYATIENNNTRVSMFENNQVDVTLDPPASELDRLFKEQKVQVLPELATYYYDFNITKAPFDNPKVRKAFALAIDRDTLVKKVAKNAYAIATGLVPPAMPDAQKGQEFRKVGGDFFKDNDIVVAKQLLAEAGYPDGKGLPPITLTYNTSEIHKAVAEAVQEMWKKNLGVEVALTNQEWKVFLKTRQSLDYQIARDAWAGDYPDALTFISLFLSNSGNNNTGWKHTDYDRLVKKAKASLDPNERMQAMHDAEKILIGEMPIIPVFYYTKPYMIKPNVKGFVHTPTSFIYFKSAYTE